MPNLLLAAFQAVEEESEGIDLLLPPRDELIAGVIAFAIVFFFAWRFALPALSRTLEARRQAVTSELTAAEGAKNEAESLLADYKAQLEEARAEAGRIIEQARETADSMRADLVSRAEADAEQIRSKAHEDVLAERARATAELRGEVASLSLDVAEKVLTASLDDSRHAALVDRYIDELGGLRQ